jgi:hypothetical protein
MSCHDVLSFGWAKLMMAIIRICMFQSGEVKKNTPEERSKIMLNTSYLQLRTLANLVSVGNQ